MTATEATHTAVLNGGRRLLRAQYDLLISNAWIKVAVGGYGSGKTAGAAPTFIRNCIDNPWTDDYGADHPESIVCGPTHSVLKESSMKALRALLPPEAVLREWKADRRWRLANGHDVLFRSVEGAIEGSNLCGLWLDEAHLLPSDAWPNLQMRVREAKARRRLILVSGLPEFGWLQDVFGRPEHYQDPDRCIVHFSTLDNHYLDPRVLAQLRASIGAADAEAYLLGKWRSSENAVFYAYAPAIHVVPQRGRRSEITHVTCDVGNRGAVLFFQVLEQTYRDAKGATWRGPHIHICDELLPENISTEDAMRAAVARGWRVGPQSMVFLDPRSNVDQMNAVRNVLGAGARIIRKTRGQTGYDVDEGHRAVNAAFRDSDGNVKLTISNTLSDRDKRCLRVSLPKVRRKPDGDGMVKDNISDHVADALRYPVAHLLPLRSGRIVVSS